MKLQSITLKNFLIIPKLTIDLDNQLNVVTGETGSGKSLFVSAVRLLRGERAQKQLVGKWGKKGEIGAIIKLDKNDNKIRTILEQLSIEPEDDILLLRRVIGDKNLNYINDMPVNLNTFVQLFADAIEISSQFENRELFKSEYQIRVIDNYALNKKEKASYWELYQRLKAVQYEMGLLQEKDNPGARDYLEFQIHEIEKLSVVIGEEAELEEKVRFYDNRQKIELFQNQITNAFEQVEQHLSEADKASQSLKDLIDFTDQYERINSLFIEAQDISRSFSTFSQDEESFESESELRERLDTINTLMMKHSVSSTESLMEKYGGMCDELEMLNHIPEKMSELESEQAKLLEKCLEKANVMRDKRMQKIPDIEKQILAYLHLFGMKGVRFNIRCDKRETLNETGIDHIHFVVNTTGGEDSFSIKTLSGGELSRLLLALKLIDNDAGKFILFDEIDSNIGGEVAAKAADELKNNSKQNQILVVTHFPQTAAKGDTHLVVEKAITDDTVQSAIRVLSADEREIELARMMGDSSSSEQLQAARKLLRS